jgi:hypothetical protein
MERCISLQNCMAGWYVYLNVLQVAFLNKVFVSLKQRHSPTVCLEGTHLYEYQLLAIVYEIWVISRKLMTRHGV